MRRKKKNQAHERAGLQLTSLRKKGGVTPGRGEKRRPGHRVAVIPDASQGVSKTG